MNMGTLSVLQSLIDQMKTEAPETQDDLFLALYQRPIIDHLRKVTTEKDVQRIIDEIQSQPSDAAQQLLFSLLRNWDHLQVTQDLYLQHFRTTHSDKVKHSILWRLLDNPELPQAFHEEIFDFIRSDWSHFHEVIVHFYGRQGIKQAITERLADPSFPTSKRWAYIASASFDDDKEWYRQLLAEFKPRNTFEERFKHEMTRGM
ncbi:MAG: hypothetical protein ACFHX7_22030 [Pseudomonadota bacterium]